MCLLQNGQNIGGGEMDRIIKDTTSEVSNMQVRFRERAKAITGAQMPPLEGEMRRRWIAQKEAAMKNIAKASTFISGPLTEVVKEVKPIEVTDDDVLSGRNLHNKP